MGSQTNTGDPARERRAFALGLVALAVIFAVDAALGSRAMLVELLVAGPLIAATGATVRQTLVVAVAALVLAIPGGLVSDAFLEVAHLVAIGIVAVGGALAVVISGLRAGRERDAARLQVQYDVARALGDAESFDEASPRLLAALARPLGRQLAQFWAQGDDGKLRCVACWSEDGFEADEFVRRSKELVLEPGRGLPGEVWETKRSAWLGDALATGTFLRNREAEAAGIRGGMAFPVTSGDECIAVVELFSREIRERDAGVYALSEALGSQIGEFIERLRAADARRLAEREREQARIQLEAILGGVADAVTAQAPDGRLLFVNDAAVAVMGFESREALLNAPIASLMDRFEVVDEEGRPFPLEALPGRRALSGEDGAESVVRFRVRDTGEERWSAVKATPVRDDDGNVTMAINVIEDITTHKRAELAQRFLARSGEVLASSLDPDQLLVEIAELAVPGVADWCAVDVVDESGRVERKALAHVDPSVRERAIEISTRYPPDPDAPAGLHQVLRTGQPELYPEIPEELLREGTQDEEHYEAILEIGMRSAIIVPMTTRGRTLGALSFVSGPSGRRFDEQDVELAQELARRCATGIDNARLYTDRSYIARTLQQSLLPVELPDIPGVEVAARFRPTGEGNEVGGDFYDMFETGNRGWAVVMGDVCGKGPDAAAVTALARYTLRAAAMRENLPSRSLATLNEALLRQRDDRRFCTVAYAYIEMLDSGARAGVSTGGHPLPLLLRADGSVQTVGHPGTLLGVVPDPSLEDEAVTLEPGDSLVFYTDGVIENRMGSDGVLDERRLAELVATCSGEGADAIASRIEEAAVLSQGGRPKDDIAVLVLRVVE
ncbi:MAG TPA: SpoIIE family protein phosphatase [Thermoleophilaceae bacterium]|nr:SpoIIE family protein phosphatase [Thermoleophilaceae bacterium]